MRAELSDAPLVSAFRRGLRDLGYAPRLIKEDYAFADVLVRGERVRRVTLAAFGQEPTSYRTACIGAIAGNHETEPDLNEYRALGAPLVFILGPNEIGRWKMTAEGDPEQLETFAPDRLQDVLNQHRHEWGPQDILRAKSIAADLLPVQLDFYDVGLLPAIDQVAKRKLDQLLTRTIAATKSAYLEDRGREPPYEKLFRLVFRLVAAKLLSDRGHPGGWNAEDPRDVVRAVEDFYFGESPPQAVLAHRGAQMVAWDQIRGAFHLQNISVETLAHVYENTLVSPDVRRRQSIYSTPPEVAEYIVRQLPFDSLGPDDRRVFEPFSGHSVFLITALGRLRELLPATATSTKRHGYFVRMLSGMEIDPFAVEVGRLSLMLADYPNPDGWNLLEGDVFGDPRLLTEISGAHAILCNPPFEDFSAAERRRYGPSLRATNKAVEILLRVLDSPPKLLGFVLPRVFTSGQSYREARRLIASSYGHVEMIALPDVAFAHSQAEAVLLIAHGPSKGTFHLRAATVKRHDYRRFTLTGEASQRADEERSAEDPTNEDELWLYPLSRLWDELAYYPRLRDVADVHRGIEYNLPFKEHQGRLVSDRPRREFDKGLVRVTDEFEPYRLGDHMYLNVSPSLMRTNAFRLHWSQPKVIASAARISRGAWTLAAAPDKSGLICYQNFHGVWPKGGAPIELIAAILNGPVANAFVSMRRTGRHNQKRVIDQVPVPDFSSRSIEAIVDMVREYQRWREGPLATADSDSAGEQYRRLLFSIDAEVLRAYDLHPRSERELLQFFSGESRPGPSEFTEYYPRGFRPAIPLHKFISEELQQATASATVGRMPTLRDPAISRFAKTLEE